MGRISAERAVVFIDWQNLYKGARGAFHHGQGPGRLGNVDPSRLARRLLQIAPRKRELAGVRVYRGQPDPTRDPRSHAANLRQSEAWTQAGVTVVQRPIRHPKAWPAERAQEAGEGHRRGAGRRLRHARRHRRLRRRHPHVDGYRLRPAPEAVVALRRRGGGPHGEVAAWTSSRSAAWLRITQANRWCHYLSVDDYRGMVDATDYTVP